jgi:hypothetical protein
MVIDRPNGIVPSCFVPADAAPPGSISSLDIGSVLFLRVAIRAPFSGAWTVEVDCSPSKDHRVCERVMAENGIKVTDKSISCAKPLPYATVLAICELAPEWVFPSPQAACDNVDAFCPGNRDS